MLQWTFVDSYVNFTDVHYASTFLFITSEKLDALYKGYSCQGINGGS